MSDTSSLILQLAISSIVAITCAYLTVRPAVVSSERAQLRQRLGEVLRIGIENPFLEDDEFISTWPTLSRSDPKYIQYNLYCCTYFNLLEDIYEFLGRNPAKVAGFIGIEEIVTTHRGWWNDGTSVKDNMAAYQARGFTTYIDEVATSTTKGRCA